MGEPERIAVVDLIGELQVRKQRIVKVLRSRTCPKERREASRGNRNVATVSQSEAIAIRFGGPTATSSRRHR